MSFGTNCHCAACRLWSIRGHGGCRLFDHSIKSCHGSGFLARALESRLTRRGARGSFTPRMIIKKSNFHSRRPGLHEARCRAGLCFCLPYIILLVSVFIINNRLFPRDTCRLLPSEALQEAPSESSSKADDDVRQGNAPPIHGPHSGPTNAWQPQGDLRHMPDKRAMLQCFSSSGRTRMACCACRIIVEHVLRGCEVLCRY